MSFPRYPATRRWASEGIAGVPAHWVERRLRDVARVVNGFPFDSSLFTPDRGLPLVRIRDLGRETTEVRYAGDIVASALIDSSDVLIGMDGDFEVGRWLGPGQGLLNQRVCCVRGSDPLVTRFIEYSLPRPLQAINDVTYSTTVKHLSSGQVERIRLVLPPGGDEIASVVYFLDRETAKIDALIAEQERLIGLLQEKRQAVISHAVTKGLDPNVPMKHSGVEWLGPIPAHWKLSAIGRLSTHIGSGKTPRGGAETYVDEGVLFLRSQNVHDDGLRLNEVVFIDAATDDDMASSRVRAGDILLNITGASLGRSCLVPVGLPAANVNQHVRIVRIAEQDTAPYVSLFMTSEFAKLWWDNVQTGAAREGLNHTQVARTPIPLPPEREQRDIVGYVQGELGRLQQTAIESARAVALLRERRTALITAAVTGQIDVRGLVETAA